MHTVERITADEYLSLDMEDRRMQLVDGQIVMNEPGLGHQMLVGRIFRALDRWVEAADGRGLVVLPLDVRLDDANVFGPDLLWYRAGGVPAIAATKPYPLPDLVVEVRSPSTWRYDIGTKKSAYEREGLSELWLVDGEGGVVLGFRRSSPEAATFDIELELDASGTLRSPQLPSFALHLGDLFDLG